jgi:hypothetical protein
MLLAGSAGAAPPGVPVSKPLDPARPPQTPAASGTLHFQKPPAPVGKLHFVGQPDLKRDKDVKELDLKDWETDLLRYQIRLVPPGPELVFRREAASAVELRMRQESKQQASPGIVVFPELPVLSQVAFTGRSLAPQVAYAEPAFVNYGRLYYEEKNGERYGWELGLLQPIISTLYFYKDTLLFPHNFVSYPHRRYETSAGQCLPGDPVPYILYPPEFTIEGTLAELGVGTALFVVFP